MPEISTGHHNTSGESIWRAFRRATEALSALTDVPKYRYAVLI
jgi:hypothetical protein